MPRRLFVLLMLVASLALVLAACTTDSDDDEVAAADDAVAEAADDATDDDEATVEEEESDDAVEEEADDSAEATDDEAVEDADDAAVEDADDAVTEDDDDAEAATDDATDDFALEDDEFEAVLAALGFDPDDEEIEAPPLDLQTMTAETPAMTLEARAYDNVYVGEITEELLVAVSMDSDYAGEADSISAYVCDGHDVGFYVTGHIENGQASIQLAENAVLEFTVNGDGISGSVAMNEQELGSFDAAEATGDAGFYVAETNVDGTDVGARWIVLEDGRQAGQMCIGVWARGVCIGVYVSRN